jgi:hypothetical protein
VEEGGDVWHWIDYTRGQAVLERSGHNWNVMGSRLLLACYY